MPKSLLERIESGDNADDNSPVYIIYTKEEARKITDRIEEKAKKRDSRKSEARLQQSAGHAIAKKLMPRHWSNAIADAKLHRQIPITASCTPRKTDTRG